MFKFVICTIYYIQLPAYSKWEGQNEKTMSVRS